MERMETTIYKNAPWQVMGSRNKLLLLDKEVGTLQLIQIKARGKKRLLLQQVRQYMKRIFQTLQEEYFLMKLL